MSNMILVNLPVRDLAASTAFYLALGGAVNPQFSGETSTSLMFTDTIGVMLLTHDKYREFTKRPIGDARRESQAMFALTVADREAVDATLTRAVAAGAPIPTQLRISASCITATLKTWMAMFGKSYGWPRQRTPKRRRIPNERDEARTR
jgi:predicted lactoylglutathione lyase